MDKNQIKINYIDIFYKIPESIQNKSYKKIITLGLSIGVTLGIIITSFLVISNKHNITVNKKINETAVITANIKKNYAYDYRL